MERYSKISVAGARGFMGRAIISVLEHEPGFEFIGGFGRKPGEGLVDRSYAIAEADVILDFTAGKAAADLAELCAREGKPSLVIGATGFDDDDLARIAAAARKIPIVRSGNFSIGVNLLAGLVARVSKILPADSWDIEILEAHHRRKVDAPSGTALMLGEAAAEGRGVPLSSVERRGRDGMAGERSIGEIGFAVMRGGGIVGEHSVAFAAADEVITLSHSALNRSMFARGAVCAARWLVGRGPGEYAMQDVLGLR